MNNATNISHQSADAAYNKRLEESANQLTLAMAQIGQHQQPHPQQDQEPDVNNSDGSGYNSEEELSTSGEQENEEDLLSYKCDMGEGGGEPSSLSSSSLTSENENDDESSSSFSDGIDSADETKIDSEIAFLQAKQRLLRRAINTIKEEEVYDASQARSTLAASTSASKPSGSQIWIEARDILSILNRREGKDVPVKRNSRDRPLVVSSDSNCSSNKRLKIDVSSVIQVSSSSVPQPTTQKDYKIISTPNPLMNSTSSAGQHSSSPFTNSLKIPFKRLSGGGPWMAKALIRSLPSSLHQNDDKSSTEDFSSTTWEIVQDPSLGAIVVPPSSVSLSQNSIQLKDALTITPEAQLVALSTPPFVVVHANKAFCRLSGKASTDVIGRPVESLAQMAQDTSEAESDNNFPSFLQTRLEGTSKACRLRVTPVVDHSSRAKNIPGAITGMSHLLITFQDAEASPSMIGDSEQLASLKGESSGKRPESTTGVRNHALGTVG